MSCADNPSKGFSVLEVMVVVLIIGILIMIAIPTYINNLRESTETLCLSNRLAIEKAAILHYHDLDNPIGTAIPGVEELVNLGYFDGEPKCPKGGLYVWADNLYAENQRPQLGCSLHFIPSGP